MSDTVSKEFVVYGMSCMGCVRGVTGAVGKVAGVRAVDVSLEESCATVEYDPSAVDPSEIVKAIEGAGFEASPR
jgi:Cu+-exporting ATPase